MAEATSAKPAIVLIHGLWMTPLSWEDWIAHYRSKGYDVLSPGWPGVDDRTPADIRADPKPMANKTITDIVDHYDAFIRTLPTPPIIMGHSFGGLFVQILLSRGLGCAGVGITPAQPAGIFSLPLSTVRATWPVLKNPFNVSGTVQITAKEFHYCFGNHLSEEDSNTIYERYAIPSVAHVLWQAALGGLSKSGPAHVEFDKTNRAPLLLIAGADDHVVARSTVEKEFAAYSKKGPAVVEFKVYEGKTHGIVNQEGWEEVADYCLEFCEKHLKN
ncbi:Alpha/Beta hydrolase protein [Lipomyces kononenkoae]|uniref:Alpha/Beta hydrolase protein n=1 Tax=Lipomyces kononenkoae TaxID=34357 RepID=A0ACC3T3Q6_LIPKO